MHGTAFAAMGIVRISDAFEPYMGIKIWLSPSGIKRQIVVVVLFDVVQHKAACLFPRVHAASRLHMSGMRLLRVGVGLLAEQRTGS